MKEAWGSLPDSTRRALKTLWQAFLGTFLVTLSMGLTDGLIGVGAMKALLVASLSAAVAATASKAVNWLMCEMEARDGRD